MVNSLENIQGQLHECGLQTPDFTYLGRTEARYLHVGIAGLVETRRAPSYPPYDSPYDGLDWSENIV